MPIRKAIFAANHATQHPVHALLCALILRACLLLPEHAQAQADTTLPSLIFEPVLLEVLSAAAPETATDYTVQELSVLPQGQTTELQSVLAARQAVSITTADELAADIAAYEQSIQALEAAGGAFDSNLDQELLALGTLLQQAGEFTRAQEVLDRSLHINRVNNGLFGLRQIPIIDRVIENHLARGDLVAADAQQEYLLYVQRKNFGDKSADLLPALTRFAEWNLFAFRARPIVQTPPEIENPSPGSPASNQTEDNSNDMVDFRTNRLINARNVYESIIHIVSSNFGAGDSRLLTFERQLALTNYLFITTFGIDSEISTSFTMPYGSYLSPFAAAEGGRPPLGFRQGQDALERRVAFFTNEPGIPPADKARAKLDLADWMLMFSKRLTALEVYKETWQEMAAAGASPEALNALFNPPIPQEIPSFLAHPFTRELLEIPDDLALEYKGYIDVAFDLNRYGITSSLAVLGKSATATPALEGRLLRNLRRTQFRPRIVDGMARETETLQIRYYFTY